MTLWHDEFEAPENLMPSPRCPNGCASKWLSLLEQWWLQADNSMARWFAMRAIPHARYKAICLPCICPASYQGYSLLRVPDVWCYALLVVHARKEERCTSAIWKFLCRNCRHLWPFSGQMVDKDQFALGLCPELHWRSLQHSPRSPSWWGGGLVPLSKNPTQLSALRASSWGLVCPLPMSPSLFVAKLRACSEMT